MKKILITGGTGYIGSHTIIDLFQKGYEPVCIDNLSNSDLSVLDGIESITGRKVIHYTIDMCDKKSLSRVFDEHEVSGVIHFAALKSVGESVNNPLGYFKNNLYSLINLLECIEESKVSNLIFSSSCSIYGNAEELPVTELTPMGLAECPYARTKQMGEQIIEDFAVPNPWFKSTLLRYFNPAGAHESALIGELPSNKATNLVPVITETAIGKREKMTVFGDTYNTRDGSCIRDYIHVMDLAAAHTLSLQHLLDGKQSKSVDIYNLGIGEGVTVLEAIHAFEAVTKQSLNYAIGDIRPGDVEAIYADNSKARTILGWNPTRTIEEIMDTAWRWEKKRSNG